MTIDTRTNTRQQMFGIYYATLLAMHERGVTINDLDAKQVAAFVRARQYVREDRANERRG